MPEVGQWGPEIFVDRRGRPTPSVTVTVYETDGVTPATLYADQAGVAVLANPLPVGVASTAAGLDDQANGSFYAPPGPYVMAVVRGGVEVYRSPVTVGVDTPSVGAGGDYLLHNQVVPTASVTVIHNFGRRPIVSVLLGEIEVDTDVEHVSVNEVSFVFPSPTAFKAILTS